jgi:hypothetical protein
MKLNNPLQVVLLLWSDGSKNQFMDGDFEMEDFILWKQSKNPDLTFETEVMSLTEYKTQYN